MQAKDLETLFHDTIKDIFYTERQILKALPKMARAVRAPHLKEAFTKHRQEIDGQVVRLQQIFALLGKRAQGKTCPAIDGILEEGCELMEEYADSPALDSALAAAAQAVEHYEMARWLVGGACWAMTRQWCCFRIHWQRRSTPLKRCLPSSPKSILPQWRLSEVKTTNNFAPDLATDRPRCK